MPNNNAPTVPSGEELYKSFMDIVLIFLKVGAFRLVNKIGINAKDIIADIKIKGSKIGSLKLSKNIPSPILPYSMIIYIDKTFPLFLLLALSFNQLSAIV